MRLTPPTMFLIAWFLFSPQFVSNLGSATIAQNNGHSPGPIIRWRIGCLAVLLCRKGLTLVIGNVFFLLLHSFATNANGNALALFGRDFQICQIRQILTGDFEGIACRSCRDFSQNRWCVTLVDVTSEYFELREKNRGGRPRIERHLF